MRRARLPRALSFAAAIAVACSLVGTAGAKPVTGEEFAVSGEQIVINEAAGTWRMTGGLVGLWKITSFKELAGEPVFKAKGTESFKGCIDTDHDGSCSGEPHGTMTFSFRYWAQATAKDELLL